MWKKRAALLINLLMLFNTILNANAILKVPNFFWRCPTIDLYALKVKKQFTFIIIYLAHHFISQRN